MYKLDVVDFNKSFELEKISEKEMYNTDDCITLVEWMSEKQNCTEEKSTLKSALNNSGKIDMVPKDTIATITWQSNNVSGNNQFITIFIKYSNNKINIVK